MLTSPYRRDAATSSITSILLYSLGVVSGPILARVLGPAGRGDVAAVLIPLFVASWALSFGVPLAAAYHLGVASEGRLLRAATAFGVIVGLPFCVLLWFMAPIYLSGHSATTITWTRVFLVLLPLSLGAQTALELRRRRRADRGWNWWRSAPTVATGVATVGLAMAGRLTLASALAANLVGNAVLLAFLAGRLWATRGEPVTLSAMKLMLPYAWRNAATVGATSITARIDQVILAVAVPTDQLGLYAVAVTVAAASGPLTSGVGIALFGHLRNEASLERAQVRFVNSLRITAAVSVTIALLLGLLAPVLLRVAFGAPFTGAALPLRLLLPGQVAMDILSLLVARLYANGRPAEASRAAILGAAITGIGLAVLVPGYGIAGAATVTSLAMAAQVVFLLARGVLRSTPNLVLDGADGAAR